MERQPASCGRLAPHSRRMTIDLLELSVLAHGVATQVIAQNEVSDDFPKKSLTTTRGEGERVCIVELGTAEDEARWVRSELERLHAAEHPWRDFAKRQVRHGHPGSRRDR